MIFTVWMCVSVGIVFGMIFFWMGRSKNWAPVEETVETREEGMLRNAISAREISIGNGKLYAPVDGKIIRIAPMGNRFVLRTKFGMKLSLQVGELTDELQGRFFRPRVVNNEIVGRGKLLLEYDMERLVGEGIRTEVTVKEEKDDYLYE